ncbi:MAG: four helix bundle protein [Segatella copri]
MSSAKDLLMTKSMDFAVRIVNLYKWLCNEKKEFVLSKQLLRSGTSIGANLSEAQSAISKADFAAKVYISLKEGKETLYWIELLYRTKYLDEKLYLSIYYLSIYKDANEMVSLLASVTKKLQPDSH